MDNRQQVLTSISSSIHSLVNEQQQEINNNSNNIINEQVQQNLQYHHNHHHHHQQPKKKKIRSKSYRIKKFIKYILHRGFWSIQSLIILLIVLGVIVTGATVWPINNSLQLQAINSVANLTKSYIERNIAFRITSYVANARNIALLTSGEMQFREMFSESVSDSRLPNNTERQIALFLNVVLHSGVPVLLYTSVFDSETCVTNINHTITSYIAKGDTAIVYLLNNMTLDMIPVMETTRDPLRPLQWFANTSLIPPGPVWVDPFTSNATPDQLTIMFSAPLVHDGRFLGAVSSVLRLDRITSFVQQTDINDGNAIAVIDKHGYLIASSVGESFKTVPDKGIVRLRASESSDRILREVAEVIRLDFNNNEESFDIDFKDSKGKKWIIIGSRISDQYGLMWLVIGIISKDYIMKNVHRANTLSAIVSSTIIAGAILVALFFGLAISIPLGTVAREMREIANMNFRNNRRRFKWAYSMFEISMISKALEQMKHSLNNFGKYLPTEVVTAVARSNSQLGLIVSPKEVTVMFLDIKDFTTITETMKPNALVQLLSEFFEGMSDIIMANAGVIDKFIGDAIMGLFNALTDLPDHPYLAIKAALEMRNVLIQMNKNWTLRGFPHIAVRIGINTDVCLIGNIGSPRRFSFTALGDGVNIASRLENLNKRYHTEIMISENTYQNVKDRILCRWVTCVSLKGKNIALHVYQVIGFYENATEEVKTICRLHDQIRVAVEHNDRVLVRQKCQELLRIDPDNISAIELLGRLSDTEGEFILKLEDKC
jgi:class 3 adenylate cyclase